MKIAPGTFNVSLSALAIKTRCVFDRRGTTRRNSFKRIVGSPATAAQSSALSRSVGRSAVTDRVAPDRRRSSSGTRKHWRPFRTAGRRTVRILGDVLPAVEIVRTSCVAGWRSEEHSR